MSRHLSALVILVVALTSIGLGAARGTVRIGDEVVLCTGHGIVVTRLPGGEGEGPRLCPDMALSLLAATDAAEVQLPARPALPEVLLLRRTAEAPLIPPQGRHARAPPVRSVSPAT